MHRIVVVIRTVESHGGDESVVMYRNELSGRLVSRGGRLDAGQFRHLRTGHEPGRPSVHRIGMGGTAGTDMALHLVERLKGRAVAEAAALAAEYDWHRDPQQPIFYPQQADVPTTKFIP